jgi:hypothetical protein
VDANCIPKLHALLHKFDEHMMLLCSGLLGQHTQPPGHWQFNQPHPHSPEEHPLFNSLP